MLGPALLVGSFAWWGFLSMRTVFDENRTETVAAELLDNEAVVDQIGVNIGRALEAAMPDSVQLTDDQVDAGVQIVLADPAVRGLIIDSLGSTHRAFLGLEDMPSTIDLGPALASSRERIAVLAPTIAAEIPEEFEVELPTERIPDASPVKRFLERTVPLLAAAATVMAVLALLTTSDRSRVLGRAARWAIGSTVFYLVVGLGIPYLLREFAPDQAEVFAALLAALLRAALFPSIVLGGIGAVLLLLSMFWPDGGGSREQARRRERVPVAASTAAMTGSQPAPTAVETTTAVSAVPALRPPSPAAVASPPPSAWAPTVGPPLGFEPPPAPRPTLPTRAKPPEPVSLAARTADELTELAALPIADPGFVAEAEAAAEAPPKWRMPTWVEGHGWVMDPDDPREPPNNARFVDGVGWVVPGPPPS